jgi:hypothetical protein
MQELQQCRGDIDARALIEVSVSLLFIDQDHRHWIGRVRRVRQAKDKNQEPGPD